MDDNQVPDYRKTPGTVYLDIYSMGHTVTHASTPALLGEPEFAEQFRYLVFREGIGTIEQMIKDRGQGKEAEQYIQHPFPVELLVSFERGLKKQNPRIPLRVIGGRLLGNSYRITEIPPIVRSRLMNFTMELVDEFGVAVDIPSFNKHSEHHNQIVYNFMSKTEITNTGDGAIERLIG